MARDGQYHENAGAIFRVWPGFYKSLKMRAYRNVVLRAGQDANPRSDD